ncbi:MAG: DUF928 domain-containing protein [Leptolyngbya sp. SIO4C1]|nr:DUF928 domain-containing protein [Leptolyngbya sp. SIO4C1]
MHLFTSQSQRSLLGRWLSPVLFGCLLLSGSAAAAPLQFNAPPRPPNTNGGRPVRRVDLGSRTPCAAAAPGKYLTALIPSPEITDQLLTRSEHPTVGVYVPFAADSIHRLQFDLWQMTDQQLTYELTLPLAVTQDLPGVVYISLPETAQPLTLAQTYRWSLSVYCDAAQLEADPYLVSGTIQRVASDVDQTLAEATPHQRAVAYAEAGLWYDALATLGALYQQTPDDAAIAADWASLLSALDIDLSALDIEFDHTDISAAPPVDCCQPVSDALRDELDER